MPRSSALMALLPLMLGTAVAAQAQNPAGAPVAQKPSAKQNDPNQTTCKRFEMPNSRLPPRTVCWTKAQGELEDDSDAKAHEYKRSIDPVRPAYTPPVEMVPH